MKARGREGEYLLLATDTLLAYFDAANPLHKKVGREVELLSRSGLEPLYPYTALLGLYSATAISKKVSLRKRVNSLVDQIARGPLIEMPTWLDVAQGGSLANQALEEGLDLSAFDTTIVATAIRTDSTLFTFNQPLRQFASKAGAKTVWSD